VRISNAQLHPIEAGPASRYAAQDAEAAGREQCALFVSMGSVRMLNEEDAALLVSRIRACIAESGIPGMALRYEIRDLKAGNLIVQGDEIVQPR
jgi:hypothetical protein